MLFVLALWWLPKRPVASRRALLAGLFLGLIVGWLALPDALLRQLENRYSTPEGSLQSYVGMVVLGGAIEMPHGVQDSQRFMLNQSAQRMTTPVALLRQYPHLKLMFSGGQSDVIARNTSVADAAREFYTSLGARSDRMLYERSARNTYENAKLSAAVQGVDKTLPWLLVTSASHMPRSLDLFQRAGWNVTPYPVDFRTGSGTPWTDYSIAQGALRWQLLLHELVGLLVLRL